ncbi:MAG: DUF1538 domain-containing protein [Oscillospiraceae bacterium]|nr:DUF1538 domain-containing protein [Oscillospiraceae bacterium]
MNQNLKEKIMESLSSVLPITAIVILLGMFLVPMPAGTLIMFLIGALMLIVGMGLFSLGVDISMMPMGDGIGEKMSQSKRMWWVAIVCFVIGIIITIAEPDLQVLANQVTAVPNMTLILTVAAGVGAFLVLSFLRTILKIPLHFVLLTFYVAVFVLAFFVPDNFISVAFDSGGVTTGPITVPFIMALGIGLASLRGDSHSEEDSFGLIALCSIGPILAVLILGICFRPEDSAYAASELLQVETTQDAWWQFLHEVPEYLKEVATALAPIMGFFLLFQLFTRKFRKRQLVQMAMGIVYTYAGLVLFLTGVNVGFMPAGQYIGQELAKLPFNWIIIPIGMIVGYFIVKAEPAVHVLNKQVEEITGGTISQKAMFRSLSMGVAVSLGLAMVRVLTGISLLWFVLPGYALALGLSFVVPRIFSAIAFDSGGVASGPMTATFLLPFAMGACQALGGNILTDAFGVVAMVAMTPLITIQLLGLSYKIKTRGAEETRDHALLPDDDEIVDYEEGVA